MRKFPFNQKGLDDLQLLLFSLPDNLLAKEVYAIRTDFRHWVKEKFILSISNRETLKHIDEQFIRHISIKSSNYVAERKTVTLTIIDYFPTQTQVSEEK